MPKLFRMPNDVTQFLNAVDAGDSKTADDLLPLAYEELRRIARSMMRHERAGHTLQPTALVHEAYIRLVGTDGESRSWETRGHFFAAVAEAMRRILVEAARRKSRKKRGSNVKPITFDEDYFQMGEPSDQLLELDEALTKLEGANESLAKIVKLRYFAGLKTAEIAVALGQSESTVNRGWKSARAWLFRELGENAD